MNREEISSKLSLISPCLGKQDFVEVLTHIYFEGGKAVTFNGVQAAIIDVGLELDCTVPGGLLQKLINSYSSKDINLEQKNKKLIVSSGKSIAKLNTLPSKDYVFEVDSIPESGSSLQIDEDFVNGISKCLVSVSDNFIEKSQSGITLDAHGDGVFLYSTDDVCLSKYTTTQKCKKSDKVILPKLFCIQVIAWRNTLGDGVLEIGLDWVKAVFDDGKAILFSKVDEEVAFLDFEEVIAQSYYEDTEVIDVPDKLKEILQRCQLITSGSEEQFVTMEISKNSIELLAESRGSVHYITDTVGVKGIEEECSFQMDCNLLTRGLEHVNKITFSSENPAGIDTVLFIGTSDNFLHLINSK